MDISPIHDKREEDLRALEQFVVDNTELESIESHLRQFNIFETLGITRRELTHSNFLAFLLDPNQLHRLGDTFLRHFLQKVTVADRDSSPIGVIDLATWSLHAVEVRREWQQIDILLIDESHDFVVIIENKIGSGEHSNQLARYLSTVRDAFPSARVMALFLTPDASMPTDRQYIPVGYDLIVEAVEAVAERGLPTLDPALQTLMTHYCLMLRRHVVTNSEIAELCARIYKKHGRALDLIFEHRLDQQSQIRDYLVELIHDTPGIVFDQSPKKEHIQFAVPDWDEPWMLTSNWTPSKRVLLFQFNNVTDALSLHLIVGPGPQETRQLLIAHAQSQTMPFRVVPSRGYRWTEIYEKLFVRYGDLEDGDIDDIQGCITGAWSEFLTSDLPRITEALNVERLRPRPMPDLPHP